jgi:hypothetical protein
MKDKTEIIKNEHSSSVKPRSKKEGKTVLLQAYGTQGILGG